MSITSHTMKADLGPKLLGYVESLVHSGNYKDKSEVLRESFRLLQDRQALAQIQQLRSLITEGEESGTPKSWNVDSFLKRMKKSQHV